MDKNSKITRQDRVSSMISENGHQNQMAGRELPKYNLYGTMSLLKRCLVYL